MQSIYKYIHILYTYSRYCSRKMKGKRKGKKNRLNILFALRCESINDVTFLLRNKSQKEDFSFLTFLFSQHESYGHSQRNLFGWRFTVKRDWMKISLAAMRIDTSRQEGNGVVPRFGHSGRTKWAAGRATCRVFSAKAFVVHVARPAQSWRVSSHAKDILYNRNPHPTSFPPCSGVRRLMRANYAAHLSFGFVAITQAQLGSKSVFSDDAVT